ncbi:hypothetical protein CALCODRAFT_479530 [Calocera cornea HHB12733]|uniref:Oxidoreductase AflY n=1 Tax=Calocera cornea HHB12733 TaxID=1353952 RepID=A0A165JMU3_9BASI|nr:hypothetical protein CALCODRAFT_479530 [Calocera cornea HHB12733]
MAKLAVRSGLVRGSVNLPGITFEGKVLTKKLLEKDYVDHHCYFRAGGLHNHLNHHLLAAYDLGAPPALLQAIYDGEASYQRPIEGEGSLKDLTIDHKNWTEYVGKPDAYKAYLMFFSQEVQEKGVTETFEKYVFDPAANGNGTEMRARFFSGAFHPVIQTGYGFEFQDPLVVAEGLAQTAIHNTTAAAVMLEPLIPTSTTKSAAHDGQRQPAHGKSILSVLRAVYASDTLHPVMPYDADGMLSKRTRDFLSVPNTDRPGEIARLCSEWTTSLPDSSDPSSLEAFERDLEARVEECMWLGLLLTFATGKKGRKPRLDFFLMHTLTSSLFLSSTLAALKTPAYKLTYLQGWLRGTIMYVILRGRPRIDPALLMSYDAYPHPPAGALTAKPGKDAWGQPGKAEMANPWAQMLASILYAPDSHTIKTMRSLVLAEQRYGTTAPGAVIGAFEEDGKTETHVGAGKLDGTAFVRAAGVLMDTMGWVDYGQKEGEWDRSALGWDEAWAHGD